MTPFKSILAATDFSAPAANAVRRAALLAKLHDSRLHIVHVVNAARTTGVRDWVSPRLDTELKIADARESLQRLAAQLSSRYQLDAQLEVRIGDVIEELHRAAARVDLLVIGQRRRHALAVLGNAAQRLVEHSRRPVLVVKRPVESDYQRALVPIDFTPAADAAAFVATALAPGIDLHVFHACDPKGEAALREAAVRESVIRECRDREQAAVVARMRRSMTRLGLDSRKMNFALGHGSPLKATLQKAQSLRADVLVATQPRRAATATSVLGNINGLLARSHCDMLIVSGWVRDPRRPQAPPQRWSATRSTGSGGWQGARVSATRAPSWTRPALAAASLSASPHGRAAGS